MTLLFRSVARSDIGLVRNINEDACLAHPRVLAVADGMGGHAAGEVASSTVITTLLKNLDRELSKDWITTTILLGSKKIAEAIHSDSEKEGMGTTLSLILSTGDTGIIGHVGDTRVYRFENDTLDQLTEDHTYVQELVDRGEITAEEALIHPRRNLLMRAIDGARTIDIDVLEVPLALGQRYLVCSDGLAGVISDIAIAEALQIEDMTLAVETLVQKALDNGAPDNVTVVLGEVSENVSEEYLLVRGADVD
jgi:serine/threonine protein phosphatase PrpC